MGDNHYKGHIQVEVNQTDSSVFYIHADYTIKTGATRYTLLGNAHTGLLDDTGKQVAGRFDFSRQHTVSEPKAVRAIVAIMDRYRSFVHEDNAFLDSSNANYFSIAFSEPEQKLFIPLPGLQLESHSSYLRADSGDILYAGAKKNSKRDQMHTYYLNQAEIQVLLPDHRKMAFQADVAQISISHPLEAPSKFTLALSGLKEDRTLGIVISPEKFSAYKTDTNFVLVYGHDGEEPLRRIQINVDDWTEHLKTAYQDFVLALSKCQSLDDFIRNELVIKEGKCDEAN